MPLEFFSKVKSAAPLITYAIIAAGPPWFARRLSQILAKNLDFSDNFGILRKTNYAPLFAKVGVEGSNPSPAPVFPFPRRRCGDASVLSAPSMPLALFVSADAPDMVGLAALPA
jgi:hypothetical protein